MWKVCRFAEKTDAKPVFAAFESTRKTSYSPKSDGEGEFTHELSQARKQKIEIAHIYMLHERRTGS